MVAVAEVVEPSLGIAGSCEIVDAVAVSTLPFRGGGPMLDEDGAVGGKYAVMLRRGHTHRRKHGPASVLIPRRHHIGCITHHVEIHVNHTVDVEILQVGTEGVPIVEPSGTIGCKFLLPLDVIVGALVTSHQEIAVPHIAHITPHKVFFINIIQRYGLVALLVNEVHAFPLLHQCVTFAEGAALVEASGNHNVTICINIAPLVTIAAGVHTPIGAQALFQRRHRMVFAVKTFGHGYEVTIDSLSVDIDVDIGLSCTDESHSIHEIGGSTTPLHRKFFHPSITIKDVLGLGV